MKKLLTLVVLLLLGLALGGGAGFAAMSLLGPRAAPAADAPEKVETSFVPAKVLAPLVGADGKLTGYVQVEFDVEVANDRAEFATARLPLLLHAINMRTFRTPLASGPDGMLADLDGFRRLVLAAAPEALGAGVVRRVAITRATPA